jgi:SAM-dependent methyltransferase
MPKYYSSFAAGFENLASEFLAADIPLDNVQILQGALVYDTPAKPDVIREIKYFKNSFLVLDMADGFKSLTAFTTAIAENTPKIHAPWKARTFHIVQMEYNTPVAISNDLKAKLIDAIKLRTRLRYCSGHGHVEFWISLRKDGTGFFMQKISKSPNPAAGELEPHIAALLARASAPKEDDVFIDPFCGSGAIPLARARMMPYRGIFAVDINPDLIAALRLKAKSIKNSKVQKSFFIKIGDFLENKFDDDFADAIVTDPPWGLHMEIDTDFYVRIFAEFARILKPGGRLVTLTARDTEIPAQPALLMHAQYDVLIHGRKATLRIFVKQ